MKKYQLTGQPIYVGETYNHNGDLYRVESFDEGYTEPKVTLRRIKDGTIFDVEAPALFLTPTGVQLLWSGGCRIIWCRPSTPRWSKRFEGGVTDERVKRQF